MSEETTNQGEDASKLAADVLSKMGGKQKLTIVKDGVEEVKEVGKPTPEEVVKYKEEFEAAVKKFQETKWEISEKGNYAANVVGMFLMDYMKRFGFWTKTGWMGMIKMDEEIKKAMANANETTAFCLDYQALEFCAYMMSSPGGVGLPLALEFEKIADQYSKIGIVVGTKVEEARTKLKEVQYLQEKYAAAEQGFYLADLEPEPEEKEGPVVDDAVHPEALKAEVNESEGEGKVITMTPTPRE
jgi:hypothetical protein